MLDESSQDCTTPLPYLITDLSKSLPSSVDDASRTSWRIVGVPSLLAVPAWLIEEMRIVILEDCDHHGKHTAVIQSSYFTDLIENDERVDVKHDPAQPSDAEICVYGRIVAARKARERWLQCVVNLSSSEYPPGVEQACRDHIQRWGWKDELDEQVLLRDISVSTCSDALAHHISHESQQAPGDIRSRFWQNYMILCLLLHTDHESQYVQTTLRSKEEDLLDALRLAMDLSKTPARPKRDRAQISSLLRALYTIAGGAVNHLYEVSGKYTAAENRDLLGSMFGTVVSNGLEDYDAEEMRRRLTTSPLFSDVTLSVQNLEHLITQMRRCLYLGYPLYHLVSNARASKILC